MAPLLAALVARIAQRLGTPVGFLNPVLYGAGGRSTLHDITKGTNGAYKASKGWDACTGLGRPEGTKLLQVLST